MSFHSKSFYSIRSTFFDDENARRRFERVRRRRRPTAPKARRLRRRFFVDADAAVRLYYNDNPKRRNLERPPALFLKNFSQFGRLSRFYRLNARSLRLPFKRRSPSNPRARSNPSPRVESSRFAASTLATERVNSLFSPQKNASSVATGATGKTLPKTLLILFFPHSDDSSKVKKRNGASAPPRAV
jgi:hypothetical protein